MALAVPPVGAFGDTSVCTLEYVPPNKRFSHGYGARTTPNEMIGRSVRSDGLVTANEESTTVFIWKLAGAPTKNPMSPGQQYVSGGEVGSFLLAASSPRRTASCCSLAIWSAAAL